MEPFTPPDGEPASLRAAAGTFRGIAGHFAQQTTVIRTQAQTALDAGEWKGGHALGFRAGADGVAAQAGDVSTSLGSLAEVLTGLAAQLQTTIDEVAKYQYMAEHALAEARHAVAGLDPASPTHDTAKAAAHLEGETTYRHYAELAARAKTRYQRQARAAAARIDALTDRAVPGGSTLDPSQINAAVDASTGIDGLAGVDSLSEAQAWAALESWTDPATSVDSLLDGLNVFGATSMTPSAAAQWWSTLTPLQQMQAIRTNPKLGNLDGVAYWARDLANRSQVGVYRDQLQRQLAELEARMPDGPSRDVGAIELSREADLIIDKLASLKTVEALADSDDHHILGLDLSHERAQAIVAQGDLDTARYVGVLAPGLTSTVQGMGGNVGHMGDLRTQAAKDLRRTMSPDQLLAAGTNQQALAASRREIATVTWLGYQAPQWNTIASANSVLSSHTAKQGGDALADFYRGIHDTRTDGGHSTAHVLAMAHSYGTPTLGYAEQQHGLHINESLMIESPGSSVSDTKDLHVPQGQSYFVEGKWDPVADAGLFGDDPSSIAGAKHLESGASTDPADGHHLESSVRHGLGNYLGKDTTTRYNAAKLLVGQTDGLVYGDDHGLGDELRREVPDEW